MSTKIYDAYKLDKIYSMFEFDALMGKLRKDFRAKCIKDIEKKVLFQFLYFYHIKELHGKEYVKNKIKETENKKGSFICDIWEYLLLEKWNTLHWMVTLNFTKHAEDESFTHDVYDFSHCLYVFPLKDKLLAMYFGRSENEFLISKNKYFSDYHYQNQTDRPEYISEKEWERRIQDWNLAIGPDFIPSHHGFRVNLFDSSNIPPKVNWNTELPTEEELVKALLNSCSCVEVPGYPKNLCDWIDFVESEPYLQWKEKKTAEIKEKCHFIREREELETLFMK